MEFPKSDYKNMLYTCHRAAQLGLPGMEPWPADKAARLMAIVQVWGNNEGFTLSPKFNVDREYIQDTYHINGGCVPDNEEFNDWLRTWIERYDAVKDKNDELFINAAEWIRLMYDFKLYC